MGFHHLLRRDGQAAFTHTETRLVASLSAPLGEALRVRARLAKLFAEHYEPVHFEDVVHVDATT